MSYRSYVGGVSRNHNPPRMGSRGSHFSLRIGQRKNECRRVCCCRNHWDTSSARQCKHGVDLQDSYSPSARCISTTMCFPNPCHYFMFFPHYGGVLLLVSTRTRENQATAMYRATPRCTPCKKQVYYAAAMAKPLVSKDVILLSLIHI